MDHLLDLRGRKARLLEKRKQLGISVRVAEHAGEQRKVLQLRMHGGTGEDGRVRRDIIAPGEPLHQRRIDDLLNVQTDLLPRGGTRGFPVELLEYIADGLVEVDAPDLIMIQQDKHMFQIRFLHETTSFMSILLYQPCSEKHIFLTPRFFESVRQAETSTM